MIANAVSGGLDKADRLDPGSGAIDLGIAGRGDLESGYVGGYVDARARLSESLSGFARGEVGRAWGEDGGLLWSALAGLRGRF